MRQKEEGLIRKIQNKQKAVNANDNERKNFNNLQSELGCSRKYKKTRSSYTYRLLLSDYFPSFKRSNCLDNDCLQFCEFPCIKCFNGDTQRLCTQCSYGYDLNNYNCYQCPNNCLDCYTQTGLWTKNNEKFCSESQKGYYSNNQILSECSQNCLSCSSLNKCFKCKETYYLTINELNQIVCLPCSLQNNCNTCIMYSNTLENFLGDSEFQTINTFEKLQKTDYQPACLTCLPNYIRKEDNKCYFCSIVGCKTCLYGNSENYNINVNVYLFSKNFVAKNLQLICIDCGDSAIATIESNMTKCEKCSDLILNCDKCYYGMYYDGNDEVKLLDSYYWRTSLSESSPRVILFCKNCALGYGYVNWKKDTCTSVCPANCEFCYATTFTHNIVCGRCNINYALFVDTGECIEFDYAATSECSRIVYPNPIKNSVPNSSATMCQLCKSADKFPSVNGFCIPKADGKCNFRYEKFQYAKFEELPDYIYYYPQELSELFQYFSSSQYNTICTTCKPGAAFYSPLNECCDMNNYPQLDKCLSCSSCSYSSYNLFCSVCEKCILESINDQEASTATKDTFIFAKKIYINLLQQYPTGNDMYNASYPSLFDELNSLQYMELDSLNLKTCYPCPILASNCKKQDSFEYEKVKSYYSSMPKLLQYFLLPTQCKQGFIYDSFKKRCIFCPHGWENCESFKEFLIYFRKKEIDFGPETYIKSFKELTNLLTKIENDYEFNYVSNEFAIKNLTYIVNFEDGVELLPNPDFSYSLSTNIKTRVPSLETVSIIFQPLDYQTDKGKVEVILAHQIAFSSFDNVIFKNITFKIIPSIMDKSNKFQNEEEFNNLLKSATGFTFNQVNVIITYCNFIHYDIDKLLYNGKIYIGELISTIDSPYIKQPMDLFVIATVNCDKNTLQLTRIGIHNLSIATPIIDQLKFSVFTKHFALFNLLSQNVFLKDLFIKNVTFRNIGLFNLGQVGNYEINIKNTEIFNSKFENIVVFSGFDFNSLNLENLYILSSLALSTTLFDFEKSSTCHLTNVLLDKNGLVSSNSDILFSVRSFSLSNIQLLNNIISSFFLFAVTDIMQNNVLDILKLLIFYNVFSTISDKLFMSVVYPSSVPDNYLSFLRLENSFIIKNDYVIVNLGSVFLLFMKYLDKISVLNATILDNNGLSLFFFDNIKETNIQNLAFEKQQESSYANQNIEMLLQIYNFISNITLTSFTIVNIKSTNNIISIMNTIVQKGNTKTVNIILQNFTMKNIFSISNIESMLAPLNIQIKNTLNFVIEQLSALDCFIDDNSEITGSSSILYLNSLTSTLYLSNMVINELTTTGRNDGFSLLGTEITIKDSHFSIGTDDGITWISSGGFLNIVAEKLKLSNCQFLESEADYGGALYISLKKLAFLMIELCTFSDVYAVEGGAFYVNSLEAALNSVVIIRSVTFVACSTDKSGGVAYFEQDPGILNKITFENCNFYGFYSYSAAILYSSYSVLIMNNCKIICISDYLNYDSKPSDVSSIIQTLSSNILINNSIFKNLKNGISGPNLFDIKDQNFNISNCEFSDFYYSNLGFALENVYMNIFNTIFKNISFISIDTSVTYEGFILARKTEISFRNCEISDFSARNVYTLAGFIKLEDSNLTFINSYASNIVGSEGGCINGINSKVLIENSYFSMIISKKNGGVLSLINSKIIINGSDFLHSRAKLIGGALYVILPNSNERSLVMNSRFINNSAQIAGAIFYQVRILEIEKQTVLFKDNSAEYYGQSIYSYPRALKFLENSSYLNSSMSSFRSGDSIFNITIYLLDEVNEIIKSQFAFSPLHITLAPFSSLKKNIAGLENKLDHYLFYSSEFFSYEIRDKKLYGVRGTKMNVTFFHPDISIPSISSNELTLGASLTFSINFRECMVGELDKMNETLGCEVCLSDFYSFSTSDIICKSCIEGLICNETGKTYVKQGYWRDSIYSESIILCDQSLYDCVGGGSHSNNLCSEGHVGAKCASCDLKGKFWPKKYARSADTQCIDCSEVKFNYAILAIVSLWSFVSMFLSVKGTLTGVKSLIQTKVIKSVAMYSLIDKGECMSSIYIKIYLSYYQIIQVINTFDLTLPSWMKKAPETVGNSVASALYSFDCLIANIEFDFPDVYFKVIFTLLIPVFYLVIFGGGYFLYVKISKNKAHFSYLYTICLFTLVNFQINIVQSLIQVLSCIKIGEKSYIKADLNFLCYTYDYWFFTLVVVLPGFLFWALLCPGGIFLFLIINRNDLNQPKNIIRFGYLYQEYKVHFWEFVKMYEKISIVFFLEFYDQDVTVKAPFILMTIALYFKLLGKYEPYSSVYLNRLEKLTTSILYFSIMFAFLAYRNTHDYLLIISYVLIGIINIIYNIIMIYFIAISFFAENNDKVKKIIVKITKILRLGNLFKIQEGNPKAIEKWRNAKRLVSRYLREKIRRQSKKIEIIQKRGSSIFDLSLEDYSPDAKNEAKIDESSIFLEEVIDLSPYHTQPIKTKI